MNRALLKGRYIVPAASFDDFLQLCVQFDYHVGPSDGPVYRVVDSLGKNPFAAMFLEFAEGVPCMLSVMHTRASEDTVTSLNFAESLYILKIAEYIGPL